FQPSHVIAPGPSEARNDITSVTSLHCFTLTAYGESPNRPVAPRPSSHISAKLDGRGIASGAPVASGLPQGSRRRPTQQLLGRRRVSCRKGFGRYSPVTVL